MQAGKTVDGKHAIMPLAAAIRQPINEERFKQINQGYDGVTCQPQIAL